MRIGYNPVSLYQQVQQVPKKPEPEAITPNSSTPSASPFMARLSEAISSADSLQKSAAQAMEQLATGQASNVHDAVLAMEKADLSLQLTAQVTQRAVDAYREISRLQV